MQPEINTENYCYSLARSLYFDSQSHNNLLLIWNGPFLTEKRRIIFGYKKDPKEMVSARVLCMYLGECMHNSQTFRSDFPLPCFVW